MVTFHRRLPRFEYLEPKTMDETLSLLAEHRGRAKVIAGGTDLLPKLKRREIKVPEFIIDLKGVPQLDYIKYDEVTGLTLGALVTIHAAEVSPIVREKFGVLHQAVESMASTQVRNRGTIAGNICNAVPSADTAPALLALEASVKLASQKGERIVSLEDFFTGPSETVLADEEILQEILVPNMPAQGRGTYLKLTPRTSMDLALVGVAAVVVAQDGICEDIRLALGAVAPTPLRARRAEEVLRGQKLTAEVIEKAAQIAGGECRPISDHRASLAYRCHMVEVLARRAIQQALA